MTSIYLWMPLLTGIIFLTACWDQPAPVPSKNVHIVSTTFPPPSQILSPTSTPIVTVTETVVLSSTTNTTPTPEIPVIVKQLSLGVPAGQGYGPWHLAVDPKHRRLYSFNIGRSRPPEDYSISIIDLETSQVIGLIHLPDTAEPKFPPTPIDLVADPYRPRLYALWGNRSEKSPLGNLVIIDLETKKILNTFSDVLAVAPGPDRLYLAGLTRLWTVDPQSLKELSSVDLQSPISTPQSLLLLNPTANRLYLSQNQNELSVFDAAHLKLLNTYTGSAQLVQAAVDEARGRVYIIDHEGTQVTLRALDSDGAPINVAPFILNDPDLRPHLRVAGLVPNLAISNSEVIVTNRTDTSGLLQILNAADLTLSKSLTIPSSPLDMVVDSITDRVYMTYNFILSLDPTTNVHQNIYTFLSLDDALADPATNQLYTLTSDGTLHILSLST